MLRIDRTAPIYPIDADVSLNEFERLIMVEDFEVAGVFDPQGRLVLVPKRGGSDTVAFTEEECAYLVGRCVTHNHPSGNVFSPQDAELASVRELRAVCPDGTTYSLARPREGWP